MQVHSNLQNHHAIKAKDGSGCPELVLQTQRLFSVQYFNFEGVECEGQIVVHESVEEDIKKVFKLIHETHFPIAKVIPIADEKYQFDDGLSCNDNNTSAFNYRTIAFTSKLSNHALGLAIDINPIQNPYIKFDELGKQNFIAPSFGVYDEAVLGTLLPTSEVVVLFKKLGWEWGGDWLLTSGRLDYQHFEKIL